jgi:hypothetical protein
MMAIPAESIKKLDDWMDQPLEGVLYDLDLLPECIHNPRDELRMRCIERLWNRVFAKE